MEYFAHYNRETGEKQYLNEHLSSVGNLAYNQIPPTVRFDNIDNDTVKKVSYYIGHFHDLGKYNAYFQQYLVGGESSNLKKHAHISACYLYSFLSKEMNDPKVDTKSQKVLFFLSYLCVRLHHESLGRRDLFPVGVWDDLRILEKHLNKAEKDILKDIGREEKFSIDEFCSYFDINYLEKNKRDFEYMPVKFQNGKISDNKWYFLLIYLFSVLIDIDKLDSAYLKPKKISLISPNNVTDYLNQKHGKNPKTGLINRREEARQSMLNVIENLTDEEVKNTRFFTLTAPTGIGKTLSSLQCVLRLQERIEQIEGYTPRIITAIPFINIIEQNKVEYENVLGEDAKMVVHHRLSDFSSNKNKGEEEVALDKVLLETESWEGDVILTTFVQLFQSIFTGKNKSLKKINKLAGSIVILDEVQSIPEEYMPIIGATLQMIGKYYGTRFVLMTATQPKILEFGDMLLKLENTQGDANAKIELLPNHKRYFEGLNRTKFVPLLNKRLDNEEFIKLFFEKWPSEKSVLIVVNTIKRSIEIYKEIKKQINMRKIDVPIYYLSTNIIPLKRREVIKQVSNILDKGQPVILVSTQTIEAGVDMDFDMAFRDFAPIDSLIQTAGRVNRKGEKGKNLPVYLVQLANDNNYVYELSHRQSTIDLLMEKEEILESEYGKLVDDYYKLALDRGVSDDSRTIWEDGIVKLDFQALEEFKLIENIGEVYDVFVEIDDRAKLLADAYEGLLKYDGNFDYNLLEKADIKYSGKKDGKIDIYERKALIRLITGKMNDYIVQVRVSKLLKNRPIEFSARGDSQSDMYWVPPEQIEQYYDEFTGFIDESGEGYIW